ncbi:MAG TPA: glycosyl transferase, partial [Lachnospiraceae bacterium]|nr:glycosyl transferase [Lachnospiraceae bacterium]
MLAICIECSHQRGMGHLFRALNLISTLEEKREPWLLLVNQDETALSVLREKKITPVIVDLEDTSSDWEGKLIREREITVWLNDRLHTGIETAEHVKAAGIPLFTIDDMGMGAALADGNFASLIFEGKSIIPGKRVYAGSEYLILNPEIAGYRRKRDQLESILVTLGGSDTYGVTLPVIDFLKNREKETGLHKRVSILLGPGSRIRAEAERAIEGTGFTLL